MFYCRNISLQHFLEQNLGIIFPLKQLVEVTSAWLHPFSASRSVFYSGFFFVFFYQALPFTLAPMALWLSIGNAAQKVTELNSISHAGLFGPDQLLPKGNGMGPREKLGPLTDRANLYPLCGCMCILKGIALTTWPTPFATYAPWSAFCSANHYATVASILLNTV